MPYLWVVLSLLSAFSLATSDALAKKALEGNNEYLVAWFRLIFSLPVLVSLFFFIPVPALDRRFYQAFCIALPVEVVTIILYIKALKSSPLSLTLPFLAVTPVFLVIVSYLVLGEKVSVQGGAGILLVAAGSYALNIDHLRTGLLGPFRAITRERGSVLMICVALLYGLTASFGKMAIEHSSPLFFGATYYLALNIAFLPIGLWMGRKSLRPFLVRGEYRQVIIPGLFYAVMVITHMTAMKLTKVAYMISVKRISLLIGVFYGYLFFREEQIGQRMVGAVLIFAGFLLLVGAS